MAEVDEFAIVGAAAPRLGVGSRGDTEAQSSEEVAGWQL
jgi:hypothetical protein